MAPLPLPSLKLPLLSLLMLPPLVAPASAQFNCLDYDTRADCLRAVTGSNSDHDPQPRCLWTGWSCSRPCGMIVEKDNCLPWKTHGCRWSAGRCQSQQLLFVLDTGHLGEVTALSVTTRLPRKFATGSKDGVIKLWDFGSGKLDTDLTTDSGAVLTLAYGNTGTVIAAGRDDGQISLFDVKTRAERVLFGVTAVPIVFVAWLPDTLVVHTTKKKKKNKKRRITVVVPLDARLVSLDAAGTISVWNATSGEIIASASASLLATSAALRGPDTLFLSHEDGNITSWNISSFIREDRTKLTTSTSTFVRAMDVSPDRAHLAGGGDDLNVYAWNLENPIATPPRSFSGNVNPITAVRFSQDSHTIATGSVDAAVELFENAIQPSTTKKKKNKKKKKKHPLVERTKLGHTAAIVDIRFTNDGKYLLSLGKDNQVRIWGLGFLQ